MNLKPIALYFVLMAVGTAGAAIAAPAPAPGQSGVPAGDGWQLLSSDADTPTSLAHVSADEMYASPRVKNSHDASSAPAPVTVGAALDLPTGAPLDSPKTWSISPTDGNYRTLLESWAKQEGVQFVWSYGQDVELGGTDRFRGDFKAAVRHVLGATELSDNPLKPCFYTNDPPLLRVVALTTKCDASQ
jgi:hypothetical protein